MQPVSGAMWYPSLMSKPCTIEHWDNAAARSRAVKSREPQSAIDLFPSRPSAMSRNLSGPFLGTAPFGSMMVGSGCPGCTNSIAP